MAQRKGAKHFAHTQRTAFMRSVKECYGSGGIVGLQAFWTDIIKTDGPARAAELMARFTPKEIDLDIEADAHIPTLGAAPVGRLEWDADMSVPEPVTVDSESGEVVD